MLVLTCKNRESAVVGGSSRSDYVLTVTALDVRGGKVRLGFEVEEDMPIHRWEVWQRIHGGQRACADNPSGNEHSVRQKVGVI